MSSMSFTTIDAICYCVAGKPENLLNYFNSSTSKQTILADLRSQILLLKAYSGLDDIHDKSVLDFVKGANYLYHTIDENTNLDEVEFPAKIGRDNLFKSPFNKKIVENYLETHDSSLFITDNPKFNKYIMYYLSTLGDLALQSNVGYKSIDLTLLAEKGEVSFFVTSYSKIKKRIEELFPDRDTDETFNSIINIIDYIFRTVINYEDDKEFVSMSMILDRIDDIVESGDNSIRLFSSFGEHYTFNVLNSRNISASIVTARNLMRLLKSGDKDVNLLAKQIRESTARIYATKNVNANASRIEVDNKLKSESAYNSFSTQELVSAYKEAYQSRLTPEDVDFPLGEEEVKEFLTILVEKRRAHGFRNFPNSLTSLFILFGFSKQFSAKATNRLFHVNFTSMEWYQFSVLFYELFGLMTVIGNLDLVNNHVMGDYEMVSSEISEMSEATADLKDFCRILSRASADYEMTVSLLDHQLNIRNNN